jgi:hypothetical protein
MVCFNLLLTDTSLIVPRSQCFLQLYWKKMKKIRLINNFNNMYIKVKLLSQWASVQRSALYHLLCNYDDYYCNRIAKYVGE